MSSEKIRTRFAPSPTGYLHVGGARTALFNYLYARANKGDFVIRVEDTDQERSDPESEKIILESLKWLGIEADEGPNEGGGFGPYRQSERLDVYEKYTERLIKKDMAYPCFCNDDELSAKQEQSRKMGVPHVYDGKCRGLSEQEINQRKEKGETFAIRFKVDSGEIAIDDLVQGRVKFDARLIGDFIIVKSNGFPSYNYAVVIDDHEMQISHIIRGVGHLSNTPRQVLIHEALGLTLPVYAHISEIVGTDKKKLSKRRGATSVLFFRDLGYLPAAFSNYMSLLGWYPRDGVEFMPSGEIAQKFDIADCSKSPAMFDFFLTDKAGEADFEPASLKRDELQKFINKKSKLNWLNNRYIRELDSEKVWPLALPFIEEVPHLKALLEKDEDRVHRAFDSVKIYVSSLADLPSYLSELFKEDLSIESEEARALLEQEESRNVVRAFTDVLSETKPATPEDFSGAMKEAGKRAGAKGRGLFMPIRIASTGAMQGLELPEFFSILGYEAVLERIATLAGEAI